MIFEDGRQPGIAYVGSVECQPYGQYWLILIFITTQFFMGIWRQLGEYLYIKKRDPNAPHTKWMQYMHGINRISLFMFLIALIVIVIKLVFFRK
jgi:hypothetical protein